MLTPIYVAVWCHWVTMSQLHQAWVLGFIITTIFPVFAWFWFGALSGLGSCGASHPHMAIFAIPCYVVAILSTSSHDDVIKWKHFPRYWPFVRGIHRSPVTPVTRSFDVYFDLRPDKRLSKQSWGWWFETLSHSLWRHRNGVVFTHDLHSCPINWTGPEWIW